MRRTVAVLLFVGMAVGPTVSFADEQARSPFRCDGQDAFFFEEMRKAGAVGYGETWDRNVCDEGVEVYAEGATSRWKAFRPRPRKLTAEQELYAGLVPVAGLATFGVVGVAAGLMALASRRGRKSRVVDVPCPGCGTKLPIVLQDPSTHSLFCPVCGTGCRAEVQGPDGPVMLRSS